MYDVQLVFVVQQITSIHGECLFIKMFHARNAVARASSMGHQVLTGDGVKCRICVTILERRNVEDQVTFNAVFQFVAKTVLLHLQFHITIYGCDFQVVLPTSLGPTVSRTVTVRIPMMDVIKHLDQPALVYVKKGTTKMRTQIPHTVKKVCFVFYTKEGISS